MIRFQQRVWVSFLNMVCLDIVLILLSSTLMNLGDMFSPLKRMALHTTQRKRQGIGIESVNRI